jgi:L-ribulokinase
MKKYVIGIDYGSNTARAVIVDTATGEEIGTGITGYPHGEKGIVTDKSNPNVARHHPSDYPVVTREAIQKAIEEASVAPGFDREKIVGIGIDTTASSPLPLDKDGIPLAFSDDFHDDINAMAWLWKDHSSADEAEEITKILEDSWPEPLSRIGGTYSSEWFWSKLLRFSRVAPEVCDAAATWIEVADWFAGWLCGVTDPYSFTRNICCAGHKGLYDSFWNGYPGPDVLTAIDPVLVKFGESIKGEVIPIGSALGRLAKEPAEYLGLPHGIAVAVPEIDAHIGALGSGIDEGRMVKILGTSGVDLVVSPIEGELPSIPGVSGVVPHSILPGYATVEGGQSAIGDIYGWFVDQLSPQGEDHTSLMTKAEMLKPGESGLLGLDWHNGNRTVLIDQKLSGLLVGMNLHTRPEHIYRSLIEATAFGSKKIIDRFKEYGIEVDEIVVSGGLPDKNCLVMQIFADILECRLIVPKSEQTAALGSAIAATVAAERLDGKDVSISDTVERMTSFRDTVYEPEVIYQPVYREIYGLYRELHDAFGTEEYSGNLGHVMKRLIRIRENASNK